MAVANIIVWFMTGLGAVVVALVAIVLLAKQRAAKLAPWKMLRNGMTAEEVKNLLGQPRQVCPLDGGESWEYAAKIHESSVIFTDGLVTGYIKPF